MPPTTKRTLREFAARPAKREQTPILIGLFGPSSSGKTYSALRLAKGIQSVVGGKIAGIDTEARRMLHYADEFEFEHIDFKEPFGSLDYLDAFKYAVNDLGAKTVIVDSMSHEHEGVGGMIWLHEQIATRMATWDGKFDEKKFERVKMLAWNEPKQNRRALLNGILQLNANFIFCFRAKNTSKPKQVPIEGTNRTKQEVVALGYMPIGGEDFVFEMTLAALLRPGAGGVPSWTSEQEGERSMIKLPGQFEFLRDDKFSGRPLDENIGAGLARWAQGAKREKTATEPRQEAQERETEQARPNTPEPEQRPQDEPTDDDRQPRDGGGYEGV
jgi:hypothetical protein